MYMGTDTLRNGQWAMGARHIASVHSVHQSHHHLRPRLSKAELAGEVSRDMFHGSNTCAFDYHIHGPNF